MDNIPPIPPIQPNIAEQYGIPNFIPWLYPSSEDRDDFIASLDSDTRAYVEKHPEEFKSRSDVMNFVNRMKGDI